MAKFFQTKLEESSSPNEGAGFPQCARIKVTPQPWVKTAASGGIVLKMISLPNNRVMTSTSKFIFQDITITRSTKV